MALTTDEREELARLLPVARAARRQHQSDSPQRRASTRVTEILAAAHAEERATVRELSADTGISYHSVARRIRLATGGPVRRRKAAPAEAAPRPAETTMEEASALPEAPAHGEEEAPGARDFPASLVGVPRAPRPLREVSAELLEAEDPFR